MFYNAFQLVRYLEKCRFPWRHLHPHLIHVPWTKGFSRFSISNCISISSAVLHNSLQGVPILYNMRENVINTQLTKLITATDMIKKLII